MSLFHGKYVTISRIVTCIVAFVFFISPAVYSQPQIIPDGNTQTSLHISGTVTDVTTSTVRGASAFNSYHKFDVYQGNTVNLFVPNGCRNLLNLVRSETTNIDGILNSIRNGQIGGHVFFANPHGFVVGSSGVVNVGALTAVTPTQTFVDTFFLSPDNPSAEATSALLDGTVPISESGLISIRGNVNATSDIILSAGSITNTGGIYSGAVFASENDAFTDVVNVTALEHGAVVSCDENGTIEIVTTQDFENSGIIVTNGSDNLDAGTIAIHAGGDISLEDGSLISAKGRGGNSDGGNIIIYADSRARFGSGAVIDARGGNESGNGGFIELSGSTVSLDGGTFKASASNGAGGTILIDPATLNIATDQTTDGADLALEADEKIDVTPGVMISTRQISDTDHLNDDSTGNSGDLRLEAPQIIIGDNAKLYAHAIGTDTDTGAAYEAGSITLLAEEDVTIGTGADITLGNDASLYSYADDVTKAGDITIQAESIVLVTPAIIPLSLFAQNAKSTITLNGPEIKGNTVTITAHSDTAKLTDDNDTLAEQFLNGTGESLLGFTALAGVLLVDSEATVQVASGTDINGTDVAITAQADATSNITTIGYYLGFTYADCDATANASIESGATITTTRTLSLNAETSNTVEAKTWAWGDTPSINVAITNATSTSNAYIENGATVTAGSLDVTALNTNNISTTAEPAEINEEGDSKGLDVVDSQLTSNATAYINADLTIPGPITIFASSITENNETTATAEPISINEDGEPDIPADEQAKVDEVTDKETDYPDKKELDEKSNSTYGDTAATKVDVSGSLALSINSNTATAYIGGDATIRSHDNISITSTTSDNFRISSVCEAEDAQFTLGGAVAYGDYTSEANAYIADGADVTAGKTLEIKGETEVPDRLEWANTPYFIENPSDVWALIEASTIDIESAIEGIFTSYVRCAATPADDGKVAAAGSVNILTVENTARAYIGTGAQINQDTDYTSWLQTVTVTALTNIDTINIAGVFSFPDFTVEPEEDDDGDGQDQGGDSKKLSVGGSYNEVDYLVNTYAYIKDDAKITAENIHVTADSTENAFVMSLAGGEAEDYGVNGAFSMTDMTTNTYAFIQDTASVDAENDLKVIATDTVKNLVITGGVVKAKTLGVGASVAINDIMSTTKAFIGNEPDTDFAGAAQNGYIHGGNNIEIKSTATDTIGSIAVAGSFASDSDTSAPDDAPDADQRQDSGKPQEGSAEKGKGKYGLAISGDVSLNDITATTLSYINLDDSAHGAEITAGSGGLTVTSVNTSHINAIGGAAAATFEDKSAGIAGSYTQNDITDTTKSYIADSTVTSDGDITVSANTSGKTKSICAGFGGGGKLGVAGSVAYNNTENKTASYISNSVIGTSEEPVGQVSLTAADISEIQSIAGAVAVGKDAIGFGAAVGINTIFNKTTAYIARSAIDATGDVIVTATSGNVTTPEDERGILTIAGSAAYGKSGSFSGTMSWNEMGNETDAYIFDCSGSQSHIDTDGSIVITAADQSTIRSISGALSFGKVGIGAAAAYNDIDNTTQAYASTSDLNAASIHLSALSPATIKTISAGGAGGNKVGLAGAISINNISNDIIASIAHSSDAQADQNIALLASDQILASDGVTVIGSTVIQSIAGAASIAGKAAIGAGVGKNAIGNTIRASVDTSSADAAATLQLSALSTATIETIAAGGAGAQTFSLGGSVTINDIDNSVDAHMSNVSAPRSVTAGGAVTVRATDYSQIKSLAGSLSFSGKASIGAAVAKNFIGNTVYSYIDNARITSTGSTIALTAANNSTISNITAAGTGAGKFALGGSVSLNDIANITDAHVSNGASVSAPGAITLTVSDTSTIESIAGTVSGGGTAAAGASVAINDIDNTVRSSINGATLTSSVGGTSLSSTSNGTIKNITAGAAGAGEFALGGAVSLNYIDNTVASYISNGAVVTIPGAISITASDTSTIKSLAGQITGAGTAAIGASIARNFIGDGKSAAESLEGNNYGGNASGNTGHTVTASINNAAVTSTASTIALGATANSTIKNITAAGGGAGTFALGGSVSLNDIASTIDAHVTNVDAGTPVSSALGVSITAGDTSTIESLAGTVQGGGTAGIGAAVATNDIGNTIRAAIHNAAISSTTIALGATSGAMIKTLSAGIAGSGTVSISGAVSLNDIANTVDAHISGVSAPKIVAATEAITISAADASTINSLSGQVAVSGTAAIGGSAAYNDIGNTVKAYTEGAVLTSGGSIALSALSLPAIETIAVGGGFSGTASVAGSVAINFMENDVLAYLQNSTVTAENNIAVVADSHNTTDTYGGTIAGGVAAGIGGTVVVNVLENDTDAFITTSTVQARGSGVASPVMSWDTAKGTVSGLAVVAECTEKVDVFAVTGAIGTVGVGANVAVTMIEDTTEATIDNSFINSEAEKGKAVIVRAYQDTTTDNFGGVLAAGAAGIGAVVDTTSISNSTKASITDSDHLARTTVYAGDGVEVSTVTAETADSSSAGGAIGLVGIAGAVSVIDISSTNEAVISESDIYSDGYLKVIASDTAVIDVDAGTISGGAVGVGGSVGVCSIGNTTNAHLTGAVTDAGGLTEVKASSAETIAITVGTGGVGGIASVAGSVAVNSITATTKAYIDSGTRISHINKDPSHETDSQDVSVTAADVATIDDMAGTVSVSLGAGVGAAVDVVTIKNTVSAYIGSGTEVDGRNVAVTAKSDKIIKSTVVAFSGGLVGINGAVSVAGIGSGLDSEAADEANNMQSTANDQISLSSGVGNLETTDEHNSTAAKAKTKTVTNKFSVDNALSTGTTQNGTTAYIADGADIDVRGNITVSAQERIALTMEAGGGAIGLVGAGGSVCISNVYANVLAYIGAATVKADENITISAELIEESLGDSLAGGAGLVGLGASVVHLNTDYNVDARIKDGAIIDEAGDLKLEAKATTNDVAETHNISVGIAAVGVSYAKATSNGYVTAAAGKDTLIGQDTGSDGVLVNSLALYATSVNSVSATSQACSGGIFSGAGAVAKTTVSPIVAAFIDDGSTIDVENDITVKGRTTVNGSAKANGTGFAALNVGVSEASAFGAPWTRSYIGTDTAIDAGGDVLIQSSGNSTITTSCTSSSGALIGVTGTTSTATGTPVLNTFIGDGTTIRADGNIDVKTDSTNTIKSYASGIILGIAAFGSNTAKAYSYYMTTPTTATPATSTAHIGKNVSITAKNVGVNAYAYNYTYANSKAGAGGGIAGVTTKALTAQNNVTSAAINASDPNNERTIRATENITIRAEGLTSLDAKADSTSAGLVGLSGARTNNSATSTVSASVGINTALDAGQDILVEAVNRTRKYDLLSSGAGGIFGASAGKSYTSFDNYTYAHIDGNSTTDALQAVEAGRNVTVSAENDVYARSKATLSCGGVIGVADARAEIYNSNTALSYLGNNTTVRAGNDVNINSRTGADILAATYTHTWGLAAGGDGTAITVLTADNDTIIGEDTWIRAGRDINIYAGQNPYYEQNYLVSHTEARSYVSGGIPWSSVTGHSDLNDYNDINIHRGVQLKAGQHITLGALYGYHSVVGYARAKKKTYLFFGIPITFYSNGSRRSVFAGTDTITVDGSLESGLNRNRSLYIEADGTVREGSYIDENGNYREWSNIGYETEEIILEDRVREKIALLDEQIAQETDNDVKGALQRERDHLQNDVLPKYVGKPPVNLYKVQDAVTGSGNITITGTLMGSGELKVPGNNFRIDIINESLSHLEIYTLKIPVESSGRVYLNGKKVTSHSGMTIDYGGNAVPEIYIYNAHPPVKEDEGEIPSDILLQGDIENIRGIVYIRNENGSIVSSANIIASTIIIEIPEGSFDHEYTPGLYNAENVIAGDYIYISAEILNINGTLQSGLPYRVVTIPADDEWVLYEQGGVKNIITTPDDRNQKIWAVYDEINDRVTLYRASFKGGQIDLYGEIVSDGDGWLKVMDGYGEVQIINNSSKDVVVNRLDNGQRINGIIRIIDTGKYVGGDSSRPQYTEITYESGNLIIAEGYYDVDANEVIITATGAAPGRSFHYDPYPGAAYAQVGDYTVTRKDVSQSNENWWSHLLFLKWAFLTTRNPYYFWQYIFVLYTSPDYYDNYLLANYGVKADYPIGIEFIGNPDFGTVTITNNGTGSVFINEAITNSFGDVSIYNAGGGVYALNDTSVVTCQNFTVDAAQGDVGSEEQALTINTIGGLLTVTGGGIVNIEEIEGDLTIASVRSSGDITLSAQGNLWDPMTPDAFVTGKDITLISTDGAIGSEMNMFIVDTGDEEGILTATAYEDIYLTEISGDIHLNKVESIDGDVLLIALDGNIEDYNFNEDVDDDTVEDLADLWDELGLSNEDKNTESIEAYKETKKVEYQVSHAYTDAEIAVIKAQRKEEYKAEHRVDDGGTPNDQTDDVYDDTFNPNWEYQLGTIDIEAKRQGIRENEKDAYMDTHRLTDQGIEEFKAQKKEEYNTAHWTDNGTPDPNDDGYDTTYDPNWEYEMTEEDYYDGTYDPNWVYDVTDDYVYDAGYDPSYTYILTDAEQKEFDEGVWSEDDLLKAKNFATIPKLDDDGKPIKTEAMIEEPNVKGHNVTIIAMAGGIGKHDTNEVISQEDIDNGNVSRDQKILIASAEKDDIDYDGEKVTVSRKLDVDVEATGTIDIEALQFIYLGSEEDVNINRVDSAMSNIRLKIDGSIINVSESDSIANVIANNLILEASDGSIGTAMKPFVIDVRYGGYLTARASQNIYLTELTGDMHIETVIAGDRVFLRTPGSIFDYNNDDILNVNADDIVLYAEGGAIGTAANDFNVETLEGSLSAQAFGDLFLTSNEHALTVDTIQSLNGNIILVSTLSVLNGNVASPANLTGATITLTSTEGGIGRPGARVTANSDGMFTIAAYEGIYLEEVAGDFVSENITSATGSVDLLIATGSGTIGKITAPGSVNVTAGGAALDITSIDPDSFDLRVLQSGGTLTVGEAYVSERAKAMADNITLRNVIHTGSSGPLHFDVSGASGGLASNTTIHTSSGSGIVFDTLRSIYASVDAQVTKLDLFNTSIGSRATINNTHYSILVDNWNIVLQECDAQLIARYRPFFLSMSDANNIFTSALALHYREGFKVNGYGSENSVTKIVPKFLFLVGGTEERLVGYYELSSYNSPLQLIAFEKEGTLFYEIVNLGIDDSEALKDPNDVDIIYE